MRTTLNKSDKIIAKTQTLYDVKNRSNTIEQALKDAIRYKKLQKLFALKYADWIRKFPAFTS